MHSQVDSRKSRSRSVRKSVCRHLLKAQLLRAPRVLFIDSDTLTVQPLDDAFVQQMQQANQSVVCHIPRGYEECNTGILGVAPSNETFQAGLRLMREQALRRHHTYGEQLFLDDLFREVHSSTRGASLSPTLLYCAGRCSRTVPTRETTAVRRPHGMLPIRLCTSGIFWAAPAIAAELS